MSPYPRFEQVASFHVEAHMSTSEQRPSCLLAWTDQMMEYSKQVLEWTVCLLLEVSTSFAKLTVGTLSKLEVVKRCLANRSSGFAKAPDALTWSRRRWWEGGGAAGEALESPAYLSS
ncbi:hypothetical protein Tco_0281927 [Tanacetum coccineum]